MWERGLGRRLSGEAGSVLIWVLLLTPALVAVLALSAEMAGLGAAARWFQGGLNRSIRAVTLQTAPLLAASGGAVGANGRHGDSPGIDPVRAEEAFRLLLAENLGLHASDLSPLPGNRRVVAAPVCRLLVYNGPFPYLFSDPESGVEVVLTEPAERPARRARG